MLRNGKIEEQLGIFIHQLKRRIVKVKDYLSLIKEGEYGIPTKGVKQHLKTAIVYLREISVLIDEIGELLKNRIHGTPLYKEKINIQKLIETVLRELKEEAKAKHITFQNTTTVPIPKILINYELVRALITNLVENSILYSESGMIRINLKRKKKAVIIEIQDSGIGFRKNDSKRLFKKFSRVGISRALHPHGLGLGLYVANMIMEAHKGKLWAQSKGLGKGATFFIKFPIQ